MFDVLVLISDASSLKLPIDDVLSFANIAVKNIEGGCVMVDPSVMDCSKTTRARCVLMHMCNQIVIHYFSAAVHDALFWGVKNLLENICVTRIYKGFRRRPRLPPLAGLPETV